MQGYAHSNCKYLRIIKMHDYHESKTVLTINDNHEFKAENVLLKREAVKETFLKSLLCLHAFSENQALRVRCKFLEKHDEEVGSFPNSL